MRLKAPAIFTAAACAALLAGCETLGYYTQAIGGQFELSRRAQPIDALMGDPATPAELRAKLTLARVLGRLPGVNDGVVRLEETEVDGMAERIVLPVGHTELIFSARVAAQTAQFLGHGRFLHEA